MAKPLSERAEPYLTRLKSAYQRLSGKAAAARSDALPLRGTVVPEHSVALPAAIALGGLATLLAVAAVIGEVVGSDGDSDAAPRSVAEVATPYSLLAPSDGRNGSPFALLNGLPLFPLGAGGLSGRENAPVEMQGVPVQSVPGPSGMWVGESEAQRVFVIPTPKALAYGALSPAVVKPGDRVNLSGRARPLPENLDAVGVTAETGHDQLLRQEMVIEASSIRPG